MLVIHSSGARSGGKPCAQLASFCTFREDTSELFDQGKWLRLD
jgi:hypothetical protein